MKIKSAEQNWISPRIKLLTVLVAGAAGGGCFSASMMNNALEQSEALRAAQLMSESVGDGASGEGSYQGQGQGQPQQ